MSLLEIRKLTHGFGGLTAVSDFNLSMESGELAGIIGPNGAGKTTLFNLITGVYKPRQGSIRLDGAELAGRRPDQIVALGLARTFQNIRLFRDLTVLDNLRAAFYVTSGYGVIEAALNLGRFSREENRIAESAREFLSLVGLERFAGESAGSLPYGLQRRLEIARALATKPKLILLDEPAAGMNPQEVGELMELILSVKSKFGLTILLIEHQMRLVMGICERLLVLDFGQTIAQGKPSDVAADKKVLEAYLGTEGVP